MELLETQDPEKRKLIETSDRHKRELEREVDELAARTQKMFTNALIIGGSLVLTYFLVRGLSGSGSKKKKYTKKIHVEESPEEQEESESLLSQALAPTLIAQIGNKVINQATLILLDIAREKLKDYLHHRSDKDENS